MLNVKSTTPKLSDSWELAELNWIFWRKWYSYATERKKERKKERNKERKGWREFYRILEQQPRDVECEMSNLQIITLSPIGES